jgi:putative cardiolipin synthase
MLWIAACATLPMLRPQDRRASYALASPRATALGRFFEAQAEQHVGHSGFALVASGREAFMARYTFALLAGKTLDVQYYISKEVSLVDSRIVK